MGPVVRVVSTDSGIGLDLEEKPVLLDQDEVGTDISVNKEKQSETSEINTEEKLILPNYTCNIYEELMVFKLDVKNVNPDSLIKNELMIKEDKEEGFSLSFVNIGAGMVPMKYGFNMAFVFDDVNGDTGVHKRILEDMEVEVWDNNIIVQLALPRNCKQYKVGSSIDDMKEYPLNHPLRTLKKKMDQIKNSKSKTSKDVEGIKKAFPGRKFGYVGQNNEEDGSNREDQYTGTSSESDLESLNDDKPGDYDTASTKRNDDSLSTESESKNVSVQASRNKSENEHDSSETVQHYDNDSFDKDDCQPRGILKRCVRRCFSESHATSQATSDNLAWSNAIFDAIKSPIAESSSSSTSSEDGTRMIDDVTSHKKSVRFNEVVQRQIFRSNSSILKQKRKNEKRLEHKLKKRGEKVHLAVERRASEGDAESLLDAGFKLSSSFEKI